jgi:hypothetical protein
MPSEAYSVKPSYLHAKFQPALFAGILMDFVTAASRCVQAAVNSDSAEFTDLLGPYDRMQMMVRFTPYTCTSFFMQNSLYGACVMVCYPALQVRDLSAFAARIDQDIKTLVPQSTSAVSARCAALEFLQRLSHVESVQLVTAKLRSFLSDVREDGSSLQRDVAAVALFRALQRVSRYCAEFAKVVSTSTAPLFQEALATIQRFDGGFVEPVRTAAVFDDTGRVLRLRRGLSEVR